MRGRGFDEAGLPVDHDSPRLPDEFEADAVAGAFHGQFDEGPREVGDNGYGSTQQVHADLVMSIHALVVDTGERRIVVDTCIGNDKERAIPA